jgi:sigma-E factor negative regulatory protein RseB
MKSVWHLLLTVTLVFLNVTAYAESDAVKTLERLGIVAKQLNYDGIFSYQSGNKLQSIRIIHHADQHGEVERLVSLSGVTREVIRNNDMVTCVYPEGKRVQENHRPLGRGFPADLLRMLSNASDYYQLSQGQQERVAEHHAQELLMKPIDNYRYGYSLWFDKDNDLLLQANLINEVGDILETFAFSSVKMNIDIPDELLKPQIQGNEMTWNRKEQHMKRYTIAMANNESLWHFDFLPEGFKLVTKKNRFKAKNGAPIEQRVYSDGLNSISVFIEKIRAQHGHLHGRSRKGIVNAFGTIISGHFVTVVGEVPAITVEKVGRSIQYITGDS